MIQTDEWATAALGTILVILSVVDENSKEDIAKSLAVLAEAAPRELVETAWVAAIDVAAEIQIERDLNVGN